MTEQHATAIPVELRAADGAQWLSGVVLQEGRMGTSRKELFAPLSVTWPAEGITVRTAHLQDDVGRAIPTRHEGGEIRIKVPATPEIRKAWDAGKRFFSAEFHALKEETRAAAGIRELLSAYLVGASLVAAPEYQQAVAELRHKRRRVWL